METVCLRFAGVYGPGKLGNVFDIFVRKALSGEELTVTGEKQARNFTYIDDAINGLKLSIFGNATGVFNLSGGKSVTILTIAEIISNIIPTKILIIKERRGDAKVQGLLSISKARKELGYSPQIDIEKGIQRYIAWYKKRRKK